MELKILYLVEKYQPFFWGTLPLRAKTFVDEFRKRGIYVEVVSFAPGRFKGKIIEENKGKKEIFLPSPFHFRGGRISRIFSYTLEWFTLSFYLLFHKKVDVIISSVPQILIGFSGTIVSSLKRIPHILEVRDLWPEFFPFQRKGIGYSLIYRILGFIARLIYSRAHCIITTNEEMKKEMTLKYHINPEKILTIPTPYQTNGNEGRLKNNKKPILLYAGNMGFAQEIDILIDVANILRKRLNNASIYVAGSGAKKREFLERLKNEGVENIVYLGELKREQILKLAKDATSWVAILKHFEGLKTALPGKLIEGMSLGIPVIASLEGVGAKIVKESGAGIVCKPGSAEEIAEAFVKIASNIEAAREMGERGKEYVRKNFNPHKLSTLYIDKIKEIAGRH